MWELYKYEEYDDGDVYTEKAGLYDIAEWWLRTYPEDIFVSAPPEIVAIREQIKAILAKRKKKDDKKM